MKIQTTYDFGDEVYLKTDPDQFKRLVCGVNIRPGNYVVYELSLGAQSSWHTEVEMNREKDILLKQEYE